MQTTIGGDRLGSGNKQEVSFKNYERSTHDLSYTWRSSMSSGTLVPFMNRLALPGDKWEIDLSAETLTLPTIGPLFGSYKVQLDVFEVPLRLYNAKLHMNKLGIGMDMSKILLPQMTLRTDNTATRRKSFSDNEQINASALVRYLGITGLGRWNQDIITQEIQNPVIRNFNATSLLAYWEIFKNYYANKAEDKAWRIHTDQGTLEQTRSPKGANLHAKNGKFKGVVLEPVTGTTALDDQVIIAYGSGAQEPDPTTIAIETSPGVQTTLSEIFTEFIWDAKYGQLTATGCKGVYTPFMVLIQPSIPLTWPYKQFGLKEFDLKNIDTMREQILQHALESAFYISHNSLEPYNDSMQAVTNGVDTWYSSVFSQESLALKTYQSDIFNNWINTEWIDGVGGITELTAVDTSSGEFTLDALNIAGKVYEMLNRIAISGGTYDNWLEAVYTHERVKGVESPVYCGSLIKELAFEEVISKSETTNSKGNTAPLGTLAGRGRMTQKNKGGRIEITVNEPSIIMGICSITPRIDYSQGNDFMSNLKNYDEFHKPPLDGIGYQDLITEKLLYSDTELSPTDYANGTWLKSSLGKQPAWLDYMTDYNRVYGSFAEEKSAMFMVLNRRYERNADGSLKDGTTYIDPTKYNNIFAQVELDSQNFWMQIHCNITARRKMSAKIIPNL